MAARFQAVPEGVRRAVSGWHADGGDRWIASLPATVDRLCDAWSLRPSGAPFDGGSHSYVLPVDRPDGTAAVLKVIYRDTENQAEPTGLRAYGGEGAVELFAYDRDTGAMLLERAEPGTPLLERAFDGLGERDAARRRIAIACGLYRRLWREAGPPGDCPPLPRSADMLSAWESVFTDPSAEVLDGIGPARAERAAALCTDLAGPPEEGIANRDTHLGNILAARREPWLLIDPKPTLGERAFDGGYFAFKQALHGVLDGPEIVRLTAEGLGADPERVGAWALLRGIEYALGVTGTAELPAVLRAVDTLEIHSFG